MLYNIILLWFSASITVWVETKFLYQSRLLKGTL